MYNINTLYLLRHVSAIVRHHQRLYTKIFKNKCSWYTYIIIIMIITTFWNFIIVSYLLGFKYTGINPCLFCKINPLVLYHIAIDKRDAVSQSKFYYIRRRLLTKTKKCRRKQRILILYILCCAGVDFINGNNLVNFKIICKCIQLLVKGKQEYGAISL
jgi:hypothetical protein